MIAIAALLQHLTRAGVTEVCIITGERPAVRQGDVLHDIAGEALSADDVLHLLFSAGGSRYVDSLGPKPAQWRTRVEGVGAVNVSAMMAEEVIEARFSLRDVSAAAGPPPLPKPRPPSVAPVKAGPRSNRNRADGAPSSRRPKASRSARPPGRSVPSDLPPTPRFADDAERQRFSNELTPPRGFPVPREALPSNLEIDLEIEIPSIPEPPPAPPPAPPARAAVRAALPPARAPSPPPAPVAPVVAAAPRPPPAELDDFESDPLSPRTLPAMGETAKAPPKPPSRPVAVAEAPARPVAPAEPPKAPARPIAPAEPPKAPARPVPPAPRSQGGSEAAAPQEHTSVPPPMLDSEPRRVRNTGRTTQPFVREAHTAQFRQLLRTARELSASDLHLVAGRPPLLRLVGQVLPCGDALDPQLVEDMVVSRVPRRLDAIFERDGSCDFSLEEPDLGRFRVNVSRHRAGVKASLRLVSLFIPTLPVLGLPEAISAATRHHQGLIVLTGPTGQGKTTTLAALVDILNTESTRHVITVEDPIEYIHPRKRAMMSQREVGTHTRGFQSALKAALREDPDVIVVGELRDTETVRIALEASETGHLVLGTMSTPSAAKAIDRLIDLFPPADQQQVRMTLAGGLRLIVGQRLLPDAEGKQLVAAAEVLPGILPLWNLIRDNRTYQIPSLQQRGRELGVIRLDDSLRDLVRAGKATPAAALAVAESPDELELTLGIRRGSQMGMAAVQPGGPPNQRPPGSPPAPPPPGLKPPEPASRGIFDRVFKKGG